MFVLDYGSEYKWNIIKARIKYYTLMVYEDADATLLRLFESFMESAPQLVLQIYILIKDPHANRKTGSSKLQLKVTKYFFN